MTNLYKELMVKNIVRIQNKKIAVNLIQILKAKKVNYSLGCADNNIFIISI